jgi:hypothetical protein
VRFPRRGFKTFEMISCGRTNSGNKVAEWHESGELVSRELDSEN